MKKWYKVTIKATIIKTQDIHATSQEAAEQEAMELFNPHSGEAEEHYTQEVISISKTKTPAERASEAVGKCPKCGRSITWFNDIPLRGFCWGTEENEHPEYSVEVPTHAIRNS